MKNLMRSLFGFGPAPTTRQVVGKSTGVDLQDVAYIRDSSKRLSELWGLTARFSGSPQEAKLRAVWEKTKNIHEYLVSKNRVHELELFHLQHTDHFLTTYTTIWEAHQKQGGGKNNAPIRTAPEVLSRAPEPLRTEKRQRTVQTGELVRALPQQSAIFTNSVADTGTPRLLVADIIVNTFTKIPYRTDAPGKGQPPYEVGCTSTPYEKEAFLHYLSEQMGISGITYVGNALVNIPNSNGTAPTGLVPVINWGGFMYAVNLNDFRIFPVKVYRKGS